MTVFQRYLPKVLLKQILKEALRVLWEISQAILWFIGLSIVAMLLYIYLPGGAS